MVKPLQKGVDGQKIMQIKHIYLLDSAVPNVKPTAAPAKWPGIKAHP